MTSALDANRHHVTAGQLRPEYIGYPIHTTTIEGRTVGFRLARYEEFSVDGELLVRLTGEPPVVAKVRPETTIWFARAVTPVRPPAPARPAAPRPATAPPADRRAAASHE